jgi:hypothetical protein
MKTYKVSNCFKSKIFGYRDSDIDSWLPVELPIAQGKAVSTIYKTKSGQTFKDMFAENGLNAEADIIPCCYSLQEVENMCEENNSNLLDNGYVNFFPITDGSKVFVLFVNRRGGQWDVYVYRLDNDDEWDADRQLFLRNVKLGDSDSLTLAIETVKKAGYQVSKIM